MNKDKMAIVALAVVAVAMAAWVVNGVVLSTDLVAADDYDDPADEGMMGAGGGGWWKNMDEKNIFGLYLNSSDESTSEFVLQARDVGVTVHSYEFDDIVFNYDADLGTGSAEAWGTANISGVYAAFHLIVEDNGGRDVDRFMLELSGDYSGTWDVTGIKGGQIWVYLV